MGASPMPHFIEFSAVADHDQQIFKALKLSAGSYLIFDKGYNNYKQFAAFTQASVFFITRQKENAVYTAVMECLHDNGSCDAILKEELIIQEYTDDNGVKQQLTLRRIAWWDDGQ